MFENLMIMFVLVVPVCLLLLFAYYVIYGKSKRLKEEYYRAIPGDLPPVLLAYYYKGKFPKNSVWVTLLDLIARNYYTLYKNGDEVFLKWNHVKLLKVNDLGVRNFEKELVVYINTRIREYGSNHEMPIEGLKVCMNQEEYFTRMTENFYEELNKELKISPYGGVARNYNVFLAVLLLVYYCAVLFLFLPVDMMAASILAFQFGFALWYSNRAYTYKQLFAYVGCCIIVSVMVSLGIMAMEYEFNILVGLGSFAWLPMLVSTYMMRIAVGKRTGKQAELYHQILGFRSFLLDLTRIYEKSIEAVAFYRRYYADAVALDVNLQTPDYVESVDDSLENSDFSDPGVDFMFENVYGFNTIDFFRN